MPIVPVPPEMSEDLEDTNDIAVSTEDVEKGVVASVSEMVKDAQLHFH